MDSRSPLTTVYRSPPYPNVSAAPQVLWKSYIDFEIEQEEFDHTRDLYQRLLQRTQHVKVRIHTPSTLTLNTPSALR